MSWSRLHRWLAIVLVAPMVVWSVTGLLFHLKPDWDRAYEMLSAERPLSTTGVVPISTLAAAFDAPIERVELFDCVLGPTYRVTTLKGTELLDAISGARRSPLRVDDARKLATDAVERAASPYGEIAEVRVEDRVTHVRFTGGATVDVHRTSARLSQRGPDTDRIDWLYRIHYLQWTGNPQVDRALGLVGLGLIWIVIIPGLVLFVQRWRQ